MDPHDISKLALVKAALIDRVTIYADSDTLAVLAIHDPAARRDAFAALVYRIASNAFIDGQQWSERILASTAGRAWAARVLCELTVALAAEPVIDLASRRAAAAGARR